MYFIRPKHWENDVVIKRLSLNEKKILVVLRWYEKNGSDMMIQPLPEYWGRFYCDQDDYMNGKIVSIPRLMRETGIKHRASLSRTLKRLEEKELVHPYGYSMIDKDINDMFGIGKYTKYVGLTSAGSDIADILNEEGFTISSWTAAVGD